MPPGRSSRSRPVPVGSRSGVGRSSPARADGGRGVGPERRGRRSPSRPPRGRELRIALRILLYAGSVKDGKAGVRLQTASGPCPSKGRAEPLISSGFTRFFKGLESVIVRAQFEGDGAPP